MSGPVGTERREPVSRWPQGRRAARPDRLAEAAPGGPHPASFAQQGLWLQAQTAPGDGGQNVALAWSLRGSLHVSALSAALRQVLARHEVLRSALVDTPDGLVQVPRDPAGSVLRVHALEALAGTPAADDLMDQAAYAPFDLARGPMLRAELFRYSADEHVLLLVVPHLAVDEWSVGILCQELSEAYAAACEGRDTVLPEPGAQYGDYARWQRERHARGELDAALAYWRRELDGAPGLLPLPADLTRPATRSLRARWQPFTVDAATNGRVEQLARRSRATPFMVLLAAYQLLVARLAGSSDVVTAIPLMGRTAPETERIVGIFVNALPLRTAVDERESFATLLERVRGTVLDAMQHQDVPFDLLVDELAAHRSGEANPLTQVGFGLNRVLEGGLSLRGLEAEELLLPGRTSPYDLLVMVSPHGAELRCSVVYSVDLFEPATAERVAGRFVTLLDAATRDPGAPTRDLELLPDAEREALAAWSVARLDGPRAGPGRGLVQRVADTAARHPQRVAVRAPDGDCSYADLERRCLALARWLRAHGVGPEVRVGVSLPACGDAVAALLAVWRAGGAVVPLDPAHPAERRAGVLADAGARVLLTSGGCDVPDGTVEAVCDLSVPLDGSWSGGARPHDDLPGDLPPDRLAYVVYTSGSSGGPKGVEVAHRGVGELLAAVGELVGPGDRTAMNVMSPSFDGWLWSTALPLAHGLTLVLHDPAEPLEAGLRAHEPDIVTVTPSALAACAVVDGVGTVVLAGEPCPPELVERWAPGRRVVNAYGPTETTVCATWADSARGHDVTTIGVPRPGVRVHVLDRHGRLAPVGVPGELAVAGPAVARGYRGRPRLTAERFVPDAVAGPGRAYRTGDRVRWTAGGLLQFLGRIDDQVKVRGFRVELGEVEAAAAGCAGVRAAAAFTAGEGPARVIGLAVVADAERGAGTVGGDLPAAVEARLRRLLPAHMVPARTLVVDSLPLGSSGKVDRAALARQASDPAPPAGTPPATPTEERLVALWAEVLGRPVDDTQASFFDVGGNSLLAARLVGSLREEFGSGVGIFHLLANPTVAALAEQMDALGEAPGGGG